MRSPAVTISPEAGLDRALTIMKTKTIRHLPVVEDNKLVGVITDRDLRLAMESMDMKGPENAPKGPYLPALKKVRTIMNSEVITVDTSETVIATVKLMNAKKVGGLPVLKEGTREVAGIVTASDLLSLLQSLLEGKKE